MCKFAFCLSSDAVGGNGWFARCWKPSLHGRRPKGNEAITVGNRCLHGRRANEVILCLDGRTIKQPNQYDVLGCFWNEKESEGYLFGCANGELVARVFHRTCSVVRNFAISISSLLGVFQIVVFH